MKCIRILYDSSLFEWFGYHLWFQCLIFFAVLMAVLLISGWLYVTKREVYKLHCLYLGEESAFVRFFCFWSHEVKFVKRA